MASDGFKPMFKPASKPRSHINQLYILFVSRTVFLPNSDNFSY